MSMSNFLENKILNHIANIETYTPPVKLYASLLTDVIDGETGQVSELSFDSYNRAPISFKRSENGVIENDTDVNFPIALENWGIVKAIAIFDAVQDGNMLFYTTLENEQNIAIDNQLIFKTGKLTISLD